MCARLTADPLGNGGYGAGMELGFLTAAREAAFLALGSNGKLSPYLHHTYDYMYLPSQLGFLASELERTDGLPGSIIEIGCALGATTVYLDRHLSEIQRDKRYFALDTFAGFLDEDIEVERVQRGRHQWSFANFRRNSIAAFERTMRLNGVERVKALQADAKTFAYQSITPFSFCLIDVDLYQPVRAALDAVFDLMTPGGVIVVDDCNANHPMWRGGYEAYPEFVASKRLREDIRHTKLGIIQV